MTVKKSAGASALRRPFKPSLIFYLHSRRGHKIAHFNFSVNQLWHFLAFLCKSFPPKPRSHRRKPRYSDPKQAIPFRYHKQAPPSHRRRNLRRFRYLYPGLSVFSHFSVSFCISPSLARLIPRPPCLKYSPLSNTAPSPLSAPFPPPRDRPPLQKQPPRAVPPAPGLSLRQDTLVPRSQTSPLIFH